MFCVFSVILLLTILSLCVQMWGSARSRVPHPLLHLSPQPSLPSPAALLQRQQLRGAGLLPGDLGEASSAPGLLDHPRRHRSWTPPEQGGHRGPQPGSHSEAVLQAACGLRGPDPESSGAGEAVRAVQHPGREGLSGSAGFLHDGDGSDSGGDAASQPWREDPGAVLRRHPHWLDAENSVQTHRVPAATAERHGETIQRLFVFSVFTNARCSWKTEYKSKKSKIFIILILILI